MKLSITGWNSEGEVVSTEAWSRPGETEDEFIARIRREDDIVEVGDLVVY